MLLGDVFISWKWYNAGSVKRMGINLVQRGFHRLYFQKHPRFSNVILAKRLCKVYDKAKSAYI